MNKTNADEVRIQAVSPEFVSALTFPEIRIVKPRKNVLNKLNPYIYYVNSKFYLYNCKLK